MRPIMVVGDVMIDTYLTGECHRISPEAPVPIINISRERSTLGGAANVAHHVANAGVPVFLAFKHGMPGFDFAHQANRILYEMLHNKKIIAQYLRTMRNFSVSTKTRVFAGDHPICRYDVEDTTFPEAHELTEWFNVIREIIIKNDIQIVLLSDYNKGTLPDSLIQELSYFCYDTGRKLILDPKRPSFVDFEYLYMVKPNGKEIEATNALPFYISNELKDTILVNTIGKDGVKVWKHGELLFEYPSVADIVIDVTGCGDSVLSIIGVALSLGLTIEEAVRAGNIAASVAIRNRGTYALNSSEISRCLNHATSK